MATRHQARMAVVSLLYAYDLGNQSIADFSDEIMEEKKIRNKQRDFAMDLFRGVTEHLAAVDEAIEVTKAFGSEQSPKFINGVLDAISKDK